MLLNALVELAACEAAERSNLQFRLDLCGARHCARNAHDFAQVKGLKVSDFLHTWQVVDSNLEPLGLGDLVAHICQEERQALAHVGLKATILALQAIHELGIFPLIAAQMSEVNVESLLFFDFQGLSQADIVPDLGIGLVLHVSVGLVVRIIRAQHECGQEGVKLGADALTERVLVLVVHPLM